MGIEFYIYLQTLLREYDIVSDNGYRFIKWMDRDPHAGGLQFFINRQNNRDNNKTIPANMIIDAYEAFHNGINIDLNWVRANGQDNWCFPAVLRHVVLL